MQKGDIHTSLADLTLAKKLFNYRPKTKPEEGIKNLSIGIKAITKFRFDLLFFNFFTIFIFLR